MKFRVQVNTDAARGYLCDQRAVGGVGPGRRRRRDFGADGEGRTDVRRRRWQRDDAGESAESEMVAASGCGLLDRREDCHSRRLRDLLVALELCDAEYLVEQLRAGRVHAKHGVAADFSDANCEPDEPVPERAGTTTRKQLENADWCRHEHRVHRPERHGATGTAVLGRPPARAAGQPVHQRQLRRRSW